MEWKEQTKRRFSESVDANKWSDIYTSLTPNVEAISFRKRRDFTVDYIIKNIPEGAAILDLGCGAGPVISRLRKYGYKLIGIDYSHDMLQHANQELESKNSEIPLIQAECERVPIIDEVFECIVCLGVISYAESIDKTLQEIYRLLKPGGQVIVSYRNKYNPILLDPVKLFIYLILLPFGFFRSEKKVIGRSISRREVLACIKKLPFCIVREEQIGFGKIQLNGKSISDGKLAIKANDIIHNVLHFLKFSYLYRIMADIHIIVLIKPV